MHIFKISSILAASESSDGAATLMSNAKMEGVRLLVDCPLEPPPQGIAHDNDLYFDLSPSDIDFQATYIRHCITHDQPWDGATSSYSTEDARNTIDIDAGRKSSQDDCFIQGLEATNVWGPAKNICGSYPDEVNFSVFFNMTFEMPFSHDEFVLENMHISQQGKCADQHEEANVWWIGGLQCEAASNGQSLVCSVPNTSYTVTFSNEEDSFNWNSNTFSVKVSPYLEDNTLDFEMAATSSGIYTVDGIMSSLAYYCVSSGQLWGGIDGFGTKSPTESYITVIASLEEASTVVKDCFQGSMLPSRVGASSTEMNFALWGDLSFQDEVGTNVILNDLYISKGVSGSDTTWFIGGPNCGTMEPDGTFSCSGQGGAVAFSSSSTNTFGVLVSGALSNNNIETSIGTETETVQSLSSSSAHMTAPTSWCLVWSIALFHVVVFVLEKSNSG